jgi:hypothetical protein
MMRSVRYIAEARRRRSTSIKHEYDEGIAIQEAIVAAGEELADAHPVSAAQELLTEQLKTDERQLEELRGLGAVHGAKGKKEDVARGMGSLMTKTLGKATTKEAEESDAYEAHAVLLSLKRKQLDSAGGMLRTSTARGDEKAAVVHRKHQRELKTATEKLSESLAEFAVRIAGQASEK